MAPLQREEHQQVFVHSINNVFPTFHRWILVVRRQQLSTRCSKCCQFLDWKTHLKHIIIRSTFDNLLFLKISYKHWTINTLDWLYIQLTCTAARQKLLPSQDVLLKQQDLQLNIVWNLHGSNPAIKQATRQKDHKPCKTLVGNEQHK